MSYKIASGSTPFNLNHSADSMFAGDFTLSFWCNFNSGGSQSQVISLQYTWEADGFTRYIAVELRTNLNSQGASDLRFGQAIFNPHNTTGAKFFQSGILVSGPETGIKNSGWNFICIRRSGSTTKITINEKSSSNNQTISFSVPSGGTFEIKADATHYQAEFAGVGIWTSSLSDSEVANLYSGNPPTLTLGGWFPLQASPESESTPSGVTLNTSGTNWICVSESPSFIHQIGTSTNKYVNVSQALNINSVVLSGANSTSEISDVDPSGAISGSYPTLQDWWDAVKSSSNPAQWARCHKGNLGPLYMTGASFTPTATSYCRIFSADWHNANPSNLDCAYIGVTDEQAAYTEVPYTRFEGLLVRSDSQNGLVLNTPANYIRIEGCLFHSTGFGSHILAIGTDSVYRIYIYSNIFISTQAGTSQSIEAFAYDEFNSVDYGGEIYSNTFWFENWVDSTSVKMPYTGLNGGTYENLKIKNNIATRNAFYSATDLGQYADIDTNIYPYQEDDDFGDWTSVPNGFGLNNGDKNPIYAPFSGNNFFVTTDFTDPRIKNGPSVGVGLDLSATISKDALNQNRVSPWDLGALNYDASVPSFETAGLGLDTVTITEQLGIQGVVNQASSSLSISDSAQANLIISQSLSDSVILSDSGTFASGGSEVHTRALSSSIIITSTVSHRAPFHISISDALLLNQGDDENLIIGKASDSILIQERINASLKVVSTSSTVLISDSGSGQSNHIYPNDRLFFAETTRANLIVIELSDSITISDSFKQSGLILTDPLSSNISIAQQVKTNQILQFASDSIFISDLTEGYNLHQYTFDDIDIVESPASRYAILNSSFAHEIEISDEGGGVNLHLYDNLVIVDEAHRLFESELEDFVTISQGIGFPVSGSDSISISDSLSGEKTKPTSSSLSILQILCTELTLKPSASDSLTISDFASGYIPDPSSPDNIPPGGGINPNPGFRIIYRKALSSNLKINDRIGVEGGLPEGCVISE